MLKKNYKSLHLCERKTIMIGLNSMKSGKKNCISRNFAFQVGKNLTLFGIVSAKAEDFFVVVVECAIETIQH